MAAGEAGHHGDNAHTYMSYGNKMGSIAGRLFFLIVLQRGVRNVLAMSRELVSWDKPYMENGECKDGLLFVIQKRVSDNQGDYS